VSLKEDTTNIHLSPYDLQIEINYFLAVGDKLFIVLQREASSTLGIFMFQQDYKQHIM
jgi:hypothetical protein